VKWVAGLSYRIKIPLAITLVIVLTEGVVTAALLSSASADARRDLEASALNLAAVLARSVRDPMLRDDLWQAYEVIRTPLEVRSPGNPLQSIAVFDAAGRVFVASDPKRLPVFSLAASLPEPQRELLAAAEAQRTFLFDAPGRTGEPLFLTSGPVLADDGTLLGAVLLAFDADLFRARVRESLRRLLLVSVPGLLLLVPLGWYGGARIAGPMSRLAAAMSRVGRDPPQSITALLPAGGPDEIGTLSMQFRQMLGELGKKESMEREMVQSERLAAVGRLSAAVAHEINNPLGGMLNSLDTLERHGAPDALTHRTIGLLQRGLQQIRATVSALLVEARLDSPALTSSDWTDLRELVQPQAGQKGVRLDWNIASHPPVPLPAHQVRQLVLNLLLNATAACTPRGAVTLDVAVRDGSLEIDVSNSSEPLSAAQIERLFEPFVSSPTKSGALSHGIGLWVSYQIANQLGGRLSARSEGGITRFSAVLPLGTKAAQDSPP
jgi:two-component system NtrC family sensor kinase